MKHVLPDLFICFGIFANPDRLDSNPTTFYLQIRELRISNPEPPDLQIRNLRISNHHLKLQKTETNPEPPDLPLSKSMSFLLALKAFEVSHYIQSLKWAPIFVTHFPWWVCFLVWHKTQFTSIAILADVWHCLCLWQGRNCLSYNLFWKLLVSHRYQSYKYHIV